MISPQINDTAADICERLIEINAPISGKNAENTYAANIEAQFETKITLIKFIQKMWSNNLILENGTNGTNTIEKEMITYIRQNFTREISLKEFGAQFHLSEKYISRYFKEHFHITLSQYINHLRRGACQTAIGGISNFSHRSCNVQWISECELLYTQLQENVWGITS